MIAKTEKPMTFRPRLVLAYTDSAHAALTCRHLRRQGWEVHLAHSGVDARRLARLLAPQVVVLDTALRDESGWLTCAKLKMENPAQRVVLVSASVTPEDQAYAEFVGALALVSRACDVPALLERMQQPTSYSAA
jgi:DNA-binding response OmpR family regulator